MTTALPPRPRDHEGKLALVTGGTKGIGLAIARALSAGGASVLVNYSRDEEAASAASAAIQGSGGECAALRADVSNGAEVSAMFAAIERDWGRLDILVNNAGITRDRLLLMMSEADWDRVLDVNLKGMFLTAKHALKPMIAKRWGRIVNITSPSATLGREGQANYSSSKAGAIGLTRTLARETARFGITVNAVSPGLIRTEMTAALEAPVLEGMLRGVATGKLGEPEDVAEAVAFLASERARYITGQVLAVDGGLA